MNRGGYGQRDLRPVAPGLKPQRAVEGIAWRIVSQRRAVVLKPGDQRHSALGTSILDGPQRFDVLKGLQHGNLLCDLTGIDALSVHGQRKGKRKEHHCRKQRLPTVLIHNIHTPFDRCYGSC